MAFLEKIGRISSLIYPQGIQRREFTLSISLQYLLYTRGYNGGWKAKESQSIDNTTQQFILYLYLFGNETKEREPRNENAEMQKFIQVYNKKGLTNVGIQLPYVEIE